MKSATTREASRQPKHASLDGAMSSRPLTAGGSGDARSSTIRKPSGHLQTISTQPLLWYKIHIVNIHQWNESIDQNSKLSDEFLIPISIIPFFFQQIRGLQVLVLQASRTLKI